MSHIDSFRHEIVGYFGSIPVYHPLETIRGDFVCGPDQIVLGGGSGEHPAMVLEDATAAVAWFLKTRLTQLQNGSVSASQDPLTARASNWLPVVQRWATEDPEALLTFYDWNEATHDAFHTLCTEGGLPNSYFQRTLSFRTWLVLGFGEFIFFAMPELAPDLMDVLSDPYAPFQHIHYSNVLLIPPRMPVYANGGNAFVSTRRSGGASAASDGE